MHFESPPARSLPVPVRLLLAAAASAAACGLPTDTGAPAPADTRAGQEPPPEVAGPWLVDATAEAGLHFVHRNGMSGQYYYCEMMGSGAALFDADNDGDLDLYLVQGGALGEDPVPAGSRLGDRLWRNDLEPGVSPPSPRFTDVTGDSGLAAYGYGMGVATGDVDNDGWTDLYVTNFGANQLWRNLGPEAGGRIRFRDITAEAGVGDERWSTGAAFFDYDGDGWLDLYVVNYVDFRLADNKVCHGPTGLRDYCGPTSYQGEPDRLFRNRGVGADGTVTFEDVSGAAGILAEAGAGMGVVASDFNSDGRPDLYVANDQTRNLLWLQEPGGKFVNRALLAGCAANMDGRAEASMGVDTGDVDNDGDDDLFMTHLRTETNTLYLNDGRGIFHDATLTTGVGTPSLGRTSFGTSLLDLDNDDWLDLAVVNGTVTRIVELHDDPYPLHQPNQLLLNLGAPGGAPGGASTRFTEATHLAHEALAVSEVSRGLAPGDVDNDGDVDLVVTNNHGPARLLLNRAGQEQPWLGLRLVGGDARRDMLGARVELRRQGASSLHRRARTDTSYCSAGDPRVLFGLGGGDRLETVRVRWPDGTREEWPAPAPGRYHTLVQGSGRPVATEVAP